MPENLPVQRSLTPARAYRFPGNILTVDLSFLRISPFGDTTASNAYDFFFVFVSFFTV